MDIKKLKKSQKGGLKKTAYSLAELILIYETISEESIFTNLKNYIQGQIDKLEKIKKTLIEKIDDDIKVDYNNRRSMVENINSTISGESKVKSSYLESLNADVRDFMAKIRNSNFSVQQMEEYISKFKAVKDKITRTYVTSYKQECIKIFKDNFENSETLTAYKEELLEYLTIVLGKGEVPNQNPFCVVLTGSPGLGKSTLANQIVNLLKVTNLLPIGRFINIKKPDVIGQYIGQTAPKTYKMLTSAIGSIAFIDEAYSFAGEERGSGGFDPFGKEFIDALVDFMEEYKGLISIVAAGYKEQMGKQFFKVNTGLERRFPIQLNIKELRAIDILKYLLDNKGLFPFLTHQYLTERSPVPFFIKNFIRLAFNIEQSVLEERSKNFSGILFQYGYIDSEGTKKYEIIPIDKNQSFILHFFNEKGLFSNNWTDVQIFVDFLTNNIILVKDPDVILVNTIKGYLLTKLKNSNIDIITEESKETGTNNYLLSIKLDTDDNEADGTFKETFALSKLKKNETEKTTEAELVEYALKNKAKFDAEVEVPKPTPKPTDSNSTSSARSSARSSASSSASSSAAAAANSKPVNSTRSVRPYSLSNSATKALSPTFEPKGENWTIMKYIIDNTPPEVLIGNYYLENFIRTLLNLEQYPENQVIYEVDYLNSRRGTVLQRTIPANQISNFFIHYFSDLSKIVTLHNLTEIINGYVGTGKSNEQIIITSIEEFLNMNRPKTECKVTINTTDYEPDGYTKTKSEYLCIRVTPQTMFDFDPGFNVTEFYVDHEMDQHRINAYKHDRYELLRSTHSYR